MTFKDLCGTLYNSVVRGGTLLLIKSKIIVNIVNLPNK